MTIIMALTDEISLEAGGGKSANLSRVARAGFPVPSGFVVSTSAYRETVEANGMTAWLLDTARSARSEDPAALETASVAIRARFAAITVPPGVDEAIRAAYAADGQPPVAVRSSATTEDLPGLSFAGQQDTLLNVVGAAALVKAVIHCWSSLWTARAIGYRARNDIGHETAALAVLVQRMVESEVSGVLFTANPLSGRRSETVIDATFGLGEALVSGRVEPDHFVVESATGRVRERRVGRKAVATRTVAGGGVTEAAESTAGLATMTDQQVLELAELGRRVAALFGTPQDVEWALTAGQFHVLQSRPITSLFPLPEQVSADGPRVLASIGAVQGMLDPFTPLGRDVYRTILPKVLASFGAPISIGEGPVVVVAGQRLFLDVTAFAGRPATRARLSGVLAMVEPTTAEALAEVYADGSRAWTGKPIHVRLPSLRFLVILTRALGNLTLNLVSPDRGRARAQRHVAAAIEAFERQAASARSLAERVALIEQAFGWLPQTGLPVLAPAFGAGLMNLALLHKLVADLPDGEQRAMELTRGLPNNVTTEMNLSLWTVALAIRADPDSTALEGFLRTYGMRGVGEIDIGRKRWRDDPTPLLQVLQSYLRIEDPEQAPDAVFRRGAETAKAALEALIVESRQARFGWMKARMVRFAARRVRALAGLRETPKFSMIRMLGVVRTSLLEGARELVSAGVLETPDDIFFLHLDELQSTGSDARAAWRALVAERRQSHAVEMRRRRVPRILLSDGQVFFGGGTVVPGDGSTLGGTPVSSGVATGTVRIVLDPAGAQLAPGEILVCPGTDPAWTPLFLAAAALVTEVGGLMTHGSVVAREYGIPAVVGVADATTRLHTGDRVRVDGTRGTVTVLAAEG